MIYEIRTYEIAPGSLASREAVRRRLRVSQEVLTPHRLLAHGDRAAHEIIHVWVTRPRRGARASGPRPRRTRTGRRRPRVHHGDERGDLTPFAFVPTPSPARLDRSSRIRYYTAEGGTLPDTAKRWEARSGARQALAVVLAGGVDFAAPMDSCTIWAYSDRTMHGDRDEAAQEGDLATPGGGNLITSRPRCPALRVFSPLQ